MVGGKVNWRAMGASLVNLFASKEFCNWRLAPEMEVGADVRDSWEWEGAFWVCRPKYRWAEMESGMVALREATEYIFTF